MDVGSIPILDKLSSSPKKIFLLDGLGAALSAFFLGVILVRFETFFGMQDFPQGFLGHPFLPKYPNIHFGLLSFHKRRYIY